ncbi:hypothetical protein [Streptomyces sp. NBC_01022]|uniref:hypothetical protein n=1 Tax=Streptomyces sp. NBC_01022 TaxID=2903723 RepID=UPI002DD8EB21|nr:hypothetical protein [Streptomyces sp. NBC_01022]WRZ86994.1 hypothetical protein OG316_07780 [Streptomyces sp. NBC_01022]
MVGRLWAAGEMPYEDALYRSDDTALEVHVDGPGAYHPDAGRPIPFRLGGPVDVAQLIEVSGTTEVDPHFESLLPDGTGWMCGGGSGMGNVGYLARLGSDHSLRWVAVMWNSNPFVGVHYEGATAVFTNDWRNRLRLDLTDPALA